MQALLKIISGSDGRSFYKKLSPGVIGQDTIPIVQLPAPAVIRAVLSGPGSPGDVGEEGHHEIGPEQYCIGVLNQILIP